MTTNLVNTIIIYIYKVLYQSSSLILKLHDYYTFFILFLVYLIPDGEEVFTYSSSDLRDTWGVTTDNHGNVYIVGRYSDSIHRLRPDGTFINIITVYGLLASFLFF
jgi:hypothetical protein